MFMELSVWELEFTKFECAVLIRLSSEVRHSFLSYWSCRVVFSSFVTGEFILGFGFFGSRNALGLGWGLEFVVRSGIGSSAMPLFNLTVLDASEV